MKPNLKRAKKFLILCFAELFGAFCYSGVILMVNTHKDQDWKKLIYSHHIIFCLIYIIVGNTNDLGKSFLKYFPGSWYGGIAITAITKPILSQVKKF